MVTMVMREFDIPDLHRTGGSRETVKSISVHRQPAGALITSKGRKHPAGWKEFRGSRVEKCCCFLTDLRLKLTVRKKKVQPLKAGQVLTYFIYFFTSHVLIYSKYVSEGS